MPTFKSNGFRDEYDYKYGIIGEVIESKKVPPNQASPNWSRGEWGHIVTIKTSDNTTHKLIGCEDTALDFKVGTTVVIGQININGHGELDFYSDKHCAVVTKQSLKPIRKLK